MTRVCIDCRYIGPRPSGIAEAVQALVEHIPPLAPDLQFHLLRHPMRGEPLSRAENVSETVVHHAANGPVSMWGLPETTDLSGIDLFHAPANIMPARLSMPCLATVHDIMWLTDPRLCETGTLGAIKQLFYAHGIRRSLRKAVAVATVSEATRAEIARYFAPAAKRTRVIPSGVAADFRPVAADRALLARVGLAPGQRFVLTVGQYAPYKNHERALAAFARAFAGRQDMALVLVQRRGASGAVLQRIATKLGIGTRVLLPGRLEREDLIQLYGSAAVLLHPSLCEGFGNPLAEAMACGCPVVTSNCSAMPEVTAGAAVLADPRDIDALADALRRVVDHPAVAAIMGQKGLARASQLSWRRFASANLELYRQVLNGRP
jgi:glycosyltransferase involved in cell wall biosynthesis